MKPTKLPSHIRRRANEIIDQIQRGIIKPRDGCVMLFDKSLVSFKIGNRWRLIVRRSLSGLSVVGVYSHEQYNDRLRQLGCG